jgi:hypothetical protein
MIDGRNKRGGATQSDAAANLIQGVLAEAKCSQYYMIGNHGIFVSSININQPNNDYNDCWRHE